LETDISKQEMVRLGTLKNLSCSELGCW